MYHSLEDFFKDWAYEAESTLKFINNLSDEALKIPKSHEKMRAMKQIVWHIIATPSEMLGLAGLHLFEVDYNAPAPESVATLKEMYEKTNENLIENIKKNWNDETLKTSDNMYGEIWAKGDTLKYMIFHQIHHRGQLSVLMRQAGLQVSGVYGPSNEEWAAMNAPAMI
ncbi:MAG: hypothetical protein EAZ85_03995 [Bacteroidetes bacterium]|nr:MAG: hypothetical protein EAZ85_03995 [Bacteroidota bacterium]TAG90706.1 MAG: hypothetical protein EAZ20_03730 [Bacteroidota bacterium]